MLVKIEKLNHQGLGITKINGKVTFVENALPGEIIDTKIIREKKKYNIAKNINIIEKSPNRIEPICKYYNKCGGCDFLHIKYEEELRFKKEKLKNILDKYANINYDIEIVPSDKIYNYRNKITLHETNGVVGLLKKQSNEIVEIEHCKLVEENINIKLKREKKPGIIRTNCDEIIMKEKEYLNIQIDKYIFRININSFFQINPYTYCKMFNYIKNNISKNQTLLDLYCGVGVFSIILSDKYDKIYGIEINKDSYKNAIFNIKNNNINNVKFFLGSVENNLKKIMERIDTIIIDPPRSGLSKSSLKQILDIRPREIIYISCDPLTLARDLKIIKDNYEIKDLKAFDMFPRTNHIESVCILIQK